MSLRTEQIEAHPGFPWLEVGVTGPVEDVLRRLGWLEADETVESCEKAGEGNMNLTLRVRTAHRSVILKQARPWVEKYDSIAAPWDRMLFEQRFYERVQSIPEVASRMPRFLGGDPESKLILIEDLSDAPDYTHLYSGKDELTQSEIAELAAYLRGLHESTRGEPDPDFANREMRALNYEHIYEVPMDANNGVELETRELWLPDQARYLRKDQSYRHALEETGVRYLADGPCLLHGDYFPGSWLKTDAGVRVIDPEFCFYGYLEFDLGVFIAHLRLTNQSYDWAKLFLREYVAGERTFSFDLRWVGRFAAAEIMRRILGVAQLPIPASQGWRAELLDLSRRAMMHMSVEDLWG